MRALVGQRGPADLDLHPARRDHLLQRGSPHRPGGCRRPGAGPDRGQPVRRPAGRRGRRHRQRGRPPHLYDHPDPAQRQPAPPAGHPHRPGEGDRPFGTGPYTLAGGGDGLALVRRDGWWQGTALPLEEIPLYEVSRSDELIYAFDAGSISLLEVDLMATNALGYGGNYQTWDYATTDLVYLGFNARSGPCQDPQVRRAIARAVDRTPLVQTTYASHAVASPLPVHPDSPLYDQGAADRLSYAPEELAGHLAELGLEGATLTLLVNSENEAKASAADLIAYQLESAGLAVQVERLPFEDFTAALAAGTFDLYLGETVLTADFDLAPLLSSAGSLNYGGWTASAADALLSVLHAAPEEEKPRAAADLFAYLEQQTPIAPLLFKNGSVLTQWGRVSGLDPIRGNVFCHLENWTVS